MNMEHVYRNRKYINICILVLIVLYVSTVIFFFIKPHSFKFQTGIIKEDAYNSYKSYPSMTIKNYTLYNFDLVQEYDWNSILEECEKRIQNCEFWKPDQNYDIFFTEEKLTRSKDKESIILQGVYSNNLIIITLPQKGNMEDTIVHEQTHYILDKYCNNKNNSLLNEGYCDYIGHKEYDKATSKLEEMLNKPDAGTIMLDFTSITYAPRTLTVSLLKRFTELTDEEVLNLNAKQLEKQLEKIKVILKDEYNKNLEIKGLSDKIVYN